MQNNPGLNKAPKKITIGAVIKEPGSSILHNTGSWRSMRPKVEPTLCKACWTCQRFCPDASISKGDKIIVIDYEHCKGCGICAHECPFKAIKMVEEKK